MHLKAEGGSQNLQHDPFLNVDFYNINTRMSTQYLTPIPQESYQKTGVLSSIIGFIILAYFFIYQGAYKTKDRSLVFEILLAAAASGLIGVGIFFSGLCVGIYM